MVRAGRHPQRNPRVFLLAALAAGLAGLTGLAACSAPREHRVAPPKSADGPPADALDTASIPDAVPRYEPASRYGNPESYAVNGQRYRVLRSARGYVERGIASWYGRKFHGRRTSSGEPYDMYAMTAAHRTLPLPTYVSVTNLDNGRRVVLRVNDRGPFHENRVIDLSYTAASKLDIVGRGTGLVEVRAIDPLKFAAATPAPSVATAAPAGTVRLYLQAGAFTERTNAERLSARLRGIGRVPVHVAPTPTARTTVYRVRLGPLADVTEADRLTRTLLDLGLETPRVVVE